MSVLDVKYRFVLRAPRLQCKACGKVAASHSDGHLRQLADFLKSGAGGVNVHIIHIVGSVFVTAEAFDTIATLAQSQTYAEGGRRWEELHLDYIRA